MFLTGMAGVAVALSTRRNNLASADSIVAKTALALMVPLRSRIDELDRTIKEQAAELHSLRAMVDGQQVTIMQLNQTNRRQEAQINLLQTQVRSLGGEPVDFDKGKAT